MKFWFAGKHDEKDLCLVYFGSHSRLRKNNSYLFHRNDFTTLISIPKKQKHLVKYNFQTQEYDSRLSWKECFDMGFVTVIQHKFCGGS